MLTLVVQLEWKPFRPGIDIVWLLRDPLQLNSSALLRFQPGSSRCLSSLVPLLTTALVVALRRQGAQALAHGHGVRALRGRLLHGR